MVNSDHGIRDIVVQVTSLWEAESEDEHEAVLVTWTSTLALMGTLPTADVKVKLRRLTTINYNNRNWSWLIDPNKPLEPLVIPKVPALGKIQSASKTKEPAREGNPPDHRSGKVESLRMDGSH